ncbi:MAG: hypothetical protein R3C45_16460 [Phycisphaerales bacterium]
MGALFRSSQPATAGLFLSLLTLSSSVMAFASVELVVDINPGPADSKPVELTRFGDKLYLSAVGESGNRSLWALDTDPLGVTVLTDVNEVTDVFGFTVYDDRLFFSADSPAAGRELWASDGAPVNTALFKDLAPGSSDGSPGYLDVGAGHLFFEADFGLWRSDGTVSGTSALSDASGYQPQHPRNFIPVGGFELFTSRGETGREVLYISNGTQTGTITIQDLHTLRLTQGYGTFVPIGDEVFFTARERVIGGPMNELHQMLYRTDGTEAGTAVIKELNITSSGWTSVVAELNGHAILTVPKSVSQEELWISDGTDAGTQLLKDLTQGESDASIEQFASVENRAFFSVVQPDSPAANELWITDGTSAGTQNIMTFLPGLYDHVDIESIMGFGDRAAFVVSYDKLFADTFPRRQEYYRELWLSDGTQAGTFPVFVSGIEGSQLQILGVFDNQLYFRGASASNGLGEELYRLSIPQLPGDLNGDGFVGIGDLNLLLAGWNKTALPGDLAAGDATGDGFVGIADLNLILGNWNTGTPPASGGTAVPEPTTCLLVFGGLVLAIHRRAV